MVTTLTDPIVSIIITAYNYEKYVESCIRSCLEQNHFQAYEVILVDDGSTDRTSIIADSFSPQIEVIHNVNSGVEHASNTGIQKARGRYLIRVDADDRLKPDYLSVMTSEMERDDALAFLYSNYTKIDFQGATLGDMRLPQFDTEEIRGRGDFLATGTLYRRTALKTVGFYNEQVPNCGLENFELTLKLLKAGYPGKLISKSLFEYRIHDANMSSTRREQIIRYGSLLSDSFGLSGYHTNENHPYGLTL